MAQSSVCSSMEYSMLLARSVERYHLGPPPPCNYYPLEWPPPEAPEVNSLFENGWLNVCHMPNFSRPLFFSECNTGLEFDLANMLVDSINDEYCNCGNLEKPGYPDCIKVQFVEVGTLPIHPGTEDQGLFEDLVAALERHDCDVAMSGIYVTDERWSKVAFGCPYAMERGAFVRSRLDPFLYLSSIEAVNDPRVKVGYMKGSWMDTPGWLHSQLSSVPSKHLFAYNSPEEGYGDILKNKIHVLIWEYAELVSWRFEKCFDCDVVDFAPRLPISWFTLPQQQNSP
ncbi:hypothetical protein Pelo_12740 [Pelomyxa schiedti]|nr:hypothetical protein Pelo_12740 [Pelomyxa schiedti]